MTNLRVFPLITDKDHDPDVMLEVARGRLESVVILGWDKDGELFFSSSLADGGDVIWLLEKAKLSLLRIGEEQEG